MSLDAVLIAGPTASGKSAAATALAMRIGGVVVNADSMQVYAEPRILTARPSDAEMARAPHLLYGHVGVREHYSVGRYLENAVAALEQARTMGKPPIFAGGTGLYFSALTEGIAEMPAVPASIREATAARRAELGPDAFFAELAARDPETASRLRASDTQRTLRAYEVIEATGKPLAWWQTQKGKPLLDGMSLSRFVMMPPRPELHARIEARFDAMVAEGALEEARALFGLDPSLPSSKILGLRELLAVTAGTRTLDEAKTLAKAATRQYAKRQMTWFRNQMSDWKQIEVAEKGNIIDWVDSVGLRDFWGDEMTERLSDILDFEYHWPAKGDHLLTGKGAWPSEADLGKWSRNFSAFVWTFKNAAETLVQSVVDGKQPANRVVWPTLHLYRHAVELALKGCIVEAAQYLGENTSLPSHRLKDLKAILFKQFEKLDFPTMDDASIGFSAVLDELDELDTTGAAFRYPQDRKGNSYELPMPYVDIVDLQRGAMKLLNYLDCVSEQINSRSEYFE